MSARDSQAVPGLPSDEVNALPQHVRDYIMWLETNADPAGTVRENFRLTEENAGLRAMIAEQRAAPEGGVPERTMMALATGWRRHAASGGRGRAVLIQCAESLEDAVIAARPQGVSDA